MTKKDTSELVLVEKRGPTTIITINRPHKRNCVNGPTARALYQAFLDFDIDSTAKVAILTGAGGNFCAGADLAAIKNQDEANPMSSDWPEELPGPIGPMGPSRMVLSKPVIAAISGFAVAGGLELALWREVRAQEALRIGLATSYPPSNEAVSEAPALEQALALAAALAEHPQTCMRNDRLSTHAAFPIRDAMLKEFELGLATLTSGEFMEAIARFFAQTESKKRTTAKL
ncbi:Enoyl-CoA hydratase [Mortierella alpina]|nr:Enoyl-CoA hydratase [Mortierella alpina]